MFHFFYKRCLLPQTSQEVIYEDLDTAVEVEEEGEEAIEEIRNMQWVESVEQAV